MALVLSLAASVVQPVLQVSKVVALIGAGPTAQVRMYTKCLGQQVARRSGPAQLNYVRACTTTSRGHLTTHETTCPASRILLLAYQCHKVTAATSSAAPGCAKSLAGALEPAHIIMRHRAGTLCRLLGIQAE